MLSTIETLEVLKKWLSALECSCMFCQDLKNIYENLKIGFRNLFMSNLLGLFAYKYLFIAFLGLKIEEISKESLREKAISVTPFLIYHLRIQTLNLGLKTFTPSTRLKCIHWSNRRLLCREHG